jgi:hypothetical protein
MQTRCRYAQAFLGLLFALEALAVFFSGFHAPRIPVYGSSVQQAGRDSVRFCSAAPGRPSPSNRANFGYIHRIGLFYTK